MDLNLDSLLSQRRKLLFLFCLVRWGTHRRGLHGESMVMSPGNTQSCAWPLLLTPIRPSFFIPGRSSLGVSQQEKRGKGIGKCPEKDVPVKTLGNLNKHGKVGVLGHCSELAFPRLLVTLFSGQGFLTGSVKLGLDTLLVFSQGHLKVNLA